MTLISTRIGTKEYTVRNACNYCGCADKVKAGIVKGVQRYQCKSCRKRYFLRTNHVVSLKRDIALSLYLEGMGLRSIGRQLEVSHTTVGRWIRQLAAERKTAIPFRADHIEIDELYLYIGNKKRKRWLWLALCRESKRILGFQIGGRGKETLKKLYYKIQPVTCLRYYTDDHAPYRKVLPKEKHRIIPGQTNTIEGVNSAIRHYLARFRRRSKCYSKSEQMAEASIELLMDKYSTRYALAG